VLLQNLLENAARHGASRLRVHGEQQSDGTVRVLVDDDGPGIALEDREAVFELFQHGSDSRGSGLGLATCRRVVERHDGRIGIEDAPDGGTRVAISLAGA
jgi:signal transduction histidine kinase